MSQAFWPPVLREGGTIAVVAPSRWCEPSWLEATRVFLEGHGYRFFVHPQNALRMGRLGGSDEARAQAVMDVFLDPSIDAVMCARGGSGSLAILDKLDYAAIKNNPKPLVGFSDATALLHAVFAQTGMVTFHGPVAGSLGLAKNPRVGQEFLAMLRQEKASLSYPMARVVRAGDVQGALVGGNLSLLECLVGTPFDWSARGCVLFIEDVNEEFYALDRTLTHLRLAGKLDGVRAVLVGDLLRVRDDPSDPYGKDLEGIILSHFDADVPVAFDLPCGHADYLTTFPLGAEARVRLDAAGVEVSVLF